MFVDISLTSQSEEALTAFESAVKSFDEILECQLLSGASDYRLRVAARNVADFDRLHRHCLSRLPRRRSDAQRLCAAHDQGVRRLSGCGPGPAGLTPPLPLLSHIPFTSFADACGRQNRAVFDRSGKQDHGEGKSDSQAADRSDANGRSLFPYYDLDGRLAANAGEIHVIIAGREEAIASAYWDAFNALPSVDRRVEGELLDSYIRGSARHTVAKYSVMPPGQDVATIACQNAHMARRVKLPLASVMSCIAESQRPTIEYVVEACLGDAERLTRLTSAVNRLALLELDIMQRYANKLDRAVFSSERQALAGDFDRSIASLVQDPDGVLLTSSPGRRPRPTRPRRA